MLCQIGVLFWVTRYPEYLVSALIATNLLFMVCIIDWLKALILEPDLWYFCFTVSVCFVSAVGRQSFDLKFKAERSSFSPERRVNEF